MHKVIDFVPSNVEIMRNRLFQPIKNGYNIKEVARELSQTGNIGNL